jgi:hypothetical protein
MKIQDIIGVIHHRLPSAQINHQPNQINCQWNHIDFALHYLDNEPGIAVYSESHEDLGDCVIVELGDLVALCENIYEINEQDK